MKRPQSRRQDFLDGLKIMDPFQEITEDKFPILEEYLAFNWPETFVISNWLKTRRQWAERTKGSKEYRFYIYALEGDVRNGIVTYGVMNNKAFYFTIYLKDENKPLMEAAFQRTSLIDLDANFVCGVPNDQRDWFRENILEKMGYRVHHDTPTDCYRIARKIPQSYIINCPDDVYVDLLKQNDVLKINTLWQHKFPGSDQLISECIKMNYGYGVYSKHTRELMAWVIKFEHGDVSILQTDSRFRRRGFARLVVQSLCKRMSDDGEDMLVFIVPGNRSSEVLFNSLGIEYTATYNWIEYVKD